MMPPADRIYDPGQGAKKDLTDTGNALWRDLQTIDDASRWREDWQSATVVNSTLVVDLTIRLPGFDLHRRQ